MSAKRKDKLDLNIRMVHEGLEKKCEHCDYSAGTNQHLWRHIRTKHPDVEDLQVEMLKCTECNEEFSRQEKLTDHFQNFHANIPNDFDTRNAGNRWCNVSYCVKCKLM